MAVCLVNNEINKDDIELLKLEEEKREVYSCIKNESINQDEKQELFKRYKELKQEIKDIAYNSAGLLNEAEYGHLLKNDKLNLDLLTEWRENKMKEMTEEELAEKLEEILKPKELTVFTKFNLMDENYADIADELDISKGYSYDLGSRARRKIEEEYDLDKVIEKLNETDISNKEVPEEDKVKNQEEPNEEDQEQQEEDKNAEPEEGQGTDDDKTAKELVITAESNEDIDEIKQLMSRIRGVDEIEAVEDRVELEQLREEVMAVFDNLN